MVDVVRFAFEVDREVARAARADEAASLRL